VGSGHASREFMCVEDCAEGIVRATQRYHSTEPVNLGVGQEITIRELVALIAEATGFHGEIRWDAGKPDGQPRRCLDTTRAAEAFGLRATVAWYVQRRTQPV
jgi:GDP-L-fucose synthase